jgi:tetratricopeptide (TPR) repeat protein
MKLAAGLSETERLYVEYFRAQRKGDDTRVRTIRFRLGQLAPDDPRVHSELGQQAFEEERFEDAVKGYSRAVELDPRSPALNMLGYSLVALGRYEEAYVALQRYSAQRPTEANPYDSLGEVALLAGRLEEAEQAFLRAAELDPRFRQAWHGVAQVRFFRGNRDGALKALERARTADGSDEHAIDLDEAKAWALLGEGRSGEALALVDAIEKDALARKELSRHAFAPVVRAQMLGELGRYEEALKQLPLARQRAMKPGVPGSLAMTIRRRALLRQLELEARQGRAADAEKTLTLLIEEAKKAEVKAELRSALFVARAAIAESKGELDGAAALYGKCDLRTAAYNYQFELRPEDSMCIYRLHQLEARRDPAAAEKVRAQFFATYRRDPMHLYAWMRLKQSPSAER